MLHLFDGAGASPAVFASLAAIRRHDPDTRHRVLLIGGPRLTDAAELGGLHDAEHLSLPGGRPWLGPTRLKPAMWRGGDPGGAGVDVVHAWSASTAIASLALARGLPRVITLTQAPPPMLAKVLAACTQPPPLGPTVLTVTDPAASRGLASLDPAALPLAIQRPPPAPGEGAATRADLRRRWGIAPGEPDVYNRVVALLADPAESADTVAGVIAAGLATETLTTRPPGERRRFRLLVHPRQRRRPRAHALMVRFGRPDTIIQEPRLEAPWRVLAGCDLAVVPPGAGQAAAAAWAMAAGVPVIAPRPGHRAGPDAQSPADADARADHTAAAFAASPAPDAAASDAAAAAAFFPHLVDGRTAWLTPADLPKAVAEALATLATRPQRGKALAEAAAAVVRDRFAPNDAALALHRLYRRAMRQEADRGDRPGSPEASQAPSRA